VTVRGYDLGNIIGMVQYCLVGFHVGYYLPHVLHLLLHLQASLGPSRFLVGKLSHRAEDGVRVSQEMRLLYFFRLCLYRMDLVLIRRSRSSDDS
jgi:hypothetical protein